MIERVEALAELFSILHDGVIVDATVEARELLLRVEIRYLTQRVRPEFTTFFVRLADVRNLAFTTWPKDSNLAPEVLHDPNAIFVPPLDILSGEVSEGRLQVVCNQPAARAPHCGGTLAFDVASADVRDESGKQYSLSELRALADAYWAEFRRAHAKS